MGPGKREIGNRLRAALAAKGISLSELARTVGKAQSAVSGWVAGRTQPDLETLARICQLTGATPAHILGLPEPKPEPATIEKDGESFKTLGSAMGKVGAGPAVLDPQEGRAYAFHVDWLRHRPGGGKNLRMVQVHKKFGDSMVPTIYPGSMLAVDLGPGGNGYSEIGPHDGKVFLVKPDPDDEHGGMVVKRVYVQDGNLVLVSDNLQTKPRVQVIALNRRPLQRFLLGRVVHVARDEE